MSIVLLASNTEYVKRTCSSVFFWKNVAVKSFKSLINMLSDFAQFIVKSKLFLSRFTVLAK